MVEEPNQIDKLPSGWTTEYYLRIIAQELITIRKELTERKTQ